MASGRLRSLNKALRARSAHARRASAPPPAPRRARAQACFRGPARLGPPAVAHRRLRSAPPPARTRPARWRLRLVAIRKLRASAVYNLISCACVFLQTVLSRDPPEWGRGMAAVGALWGPSGSPGLWVALRWLSSYPYHPACYPRSWRTQRDRRSPPSVPFLPRARPPLPAPLLGTAELRPPPVPEATRGAGPRPGQCASASPYLPPTGPRPAQAPGARGSGPRPAFALRSSPPATPA